MTTRSSDFERLDKPALVISTLEALAAPVGLRLFHGDVAGGARMRIKQSGQLMAARFPSSAWRPRHEADELASGVTAWFDPAQRLRVGLSVIRWKVLPEVGCQMEEDCQRARGEGGVPNRACKQKSEGRRTRCA